MHSNCILDSVANLLVRHMVDSDSLIVLRQREIDATMRKQQTVIV